MLETPALELWRARLEAGCDGQQRHDWRTWRLDALWRAACLEKAAVDAYLEGHLNSVDVLLRRARLTIAIEIRNASGATGSKSLV
jgi:hypothetical protein